MTSLPALALALALTACTATTAPAVRSSSTTTARRAPSTTSPATRGGTPYRDADGFCLWTDPASVKPGVDPDPTCNERPAP